MTTYSKINIVYRLQKWMDSVPGQTFLNYAYSWGAAVVILGTLFKLTHLPGANLMLYLGMGTEVVVFFLSAFDRPFDKTADGMDLPTHLDGEEAAGAEDAAPEAEHPVANGQPVIVFNGGGVGNGAYGAPAVAQETPAMAQEASAMAHGTHETHAPHSPHEAATAAEQPAVIPPLTPDMTEATNAYVDELKKLTEVLERVSEQSRRLTTDSEEMENLNRTLTGICKVYEMQLKSASSQIGTIDEINEQTKRLAQQITELNAIYTRMIEAMSVRAAL